MYFDAEVLNKYDNITFVSPLKNLNIFGRLLRKLFFTFNIFNPFFAGKYIRELNHYDRIILFAGYSEKDIIAKYINNRIKGQDKTKLIYWYWNPVKISTHPEYIRINASKFELWSFDKDDCNNFSLYFNTTFYSRFVKASINDKLYDIYFVGRNKGRIEKIQKIRKITQELNLSFYTYIIDEDSKNIKPLLSPRINIENISKSSAILDILQEGQSGLTLRSMEAIFLKKKLITTDISIKEHPFYTSQNIFIIDHDNINDLSMFLNEPYKTIDLDLVYYYDIEFWIKRFK